MPTQRCIPPHEQDVTTVTPISHPRAVHDTSTPANLSSDPTPDFASTPVPNIGSRIAWSPPGLSMELPGNQNQNNIGTNLPSSPSSSNHTRQSTVTMEGLAAAFSGNGQFRINDGINPGERTQPFTTAASNSYSFPSPETGFDRVRDFNNTKSFPAPTTKMTCEKPCASPPHEHTNLLHLAVASGNADTLRLVLENIDIATDVRDALGFTALERAVLQGRTDLVAVLLDHGVDNGETGRARSTG